MQTLKLPKAKCSSYYYQCIIIIIIIYFFYNDTRYLWILEFLHPVNCEESQSGKTKWKCIPTTSTILIHYLKCIPQRRFGEIWRKWSWIQWLTREGRIQKPSRYIGPVTVSSHSIHSYSLTYYRHIIRRGNLW